MKNYRKYIAAGVTAAVVATGAAPGASTVVEAAASDFSDVKTDAWYYNNVDYLVNKNVLAGYEDHTLRPLATLTRAEAAKMIVTTLGIDVSKDVKLPFSDTKDNAWYSPVVAALVDLDILAGFPDGTFKPNATVTRAEFSKMVVEAYKLEAKTNSALNFSDLVRGAWYEKDVLTLASYGIVGGKPNNIFDPNATVLRAEAAAFIHRTEVPSERLGYEEELAIKSVAVSTDNVAVTTVAAQLAGVNEGAEVKVDIFSKDETKKEALATKVVNVEKAGVAAEFKELPVGDYVAKVTIGQGESALIAEEEFTVDALKIESVKGLTTVVDVDTDKQFLHFSVNGETISAEYLKQLGYQFEFLTSKDVLANTATGELNKAKLTAGESFDYQVKVTGNGVEVTSPVTTVAVESYATSIVAIKNAELLFNRDVKNTSGTISTTDRNIRLANIEVEYKDGQTAKLAANEKDVFTFSSSNEAVALIDKEGNITPISDGKVTFTMKSGSVTRTVNAVVTSATRKATSATVSKSGIGLVVGGTDSIALQVKDQFGDAVKGFAVAIDSVQNKDEQTIVTAAYNPEAGTDAEGNVVVNVAADATNEGTGTLEVKNGDGDVLTTLNVTVDADLEVATRALELANPAKDLHLDLNKFDTTDQTVALALNEYNQSALKIGGHDLSAGKYSISSTDEKVFTVTGTDAKDGVFTVQAVGTGTAKVQVKEGSIVRYETTVTVSDSTPTLASAAFKNELKITSTDAVNLDNLLESLAFTGEKGDAKVTYSIGSNAELVISLTDGQVTEKVATVSAFSVNVPNAGFFTKDSAFFLGDAVKKAGFASDAEGSIVLRLNRAGETSAVVTTVIQVNE